MNYKKIYNSLVYSRQKLNRNSNVGSGLEKHHIIPKSLGGTDSKTNIVILTPREHCFAHILLSKMYTGESKGKMCYALISMMKLRNKNRSSISSKQYEILRKAHYKALNDPDYKELRSQNTKKQWTPERRAAVSEKAKQQWRDGPKREIFASDEYKSKQSKNMKKRWQDAEYQKFISDSVTNQWKDPTKKPNR